MQCECGKCIWCRPGARSELNRRVYVAAKENKMSITGPGCITCEGTGTIPIVSMGIKSGIERIPCPDCNLFSHPELDPENHQEQAEPKPNSLPFVKDLVIEDMKYRAEVGKSRYKTYLQPFNGRDVLRDAYEEALDLCIYLRQAMYEKDGR